MFSVARSSPLDIPPPTPLTKYGHKSGLAWWYHHMDDAESAENEPDFFDESQFIDDRDLPKRYRPVNSRRWTRPQIRSDPFSHGYSTNK